MSMLSSIVLGHRPQPPYQANDSLFSLTESLHDNKVHLLLAASGSVATIKLPQIIKTLTARYPDDLSIRVLLTPSASEFLKGQSAEQPHFETLSSLVGVDGVYVDEDEWREPWQRGNAILHIELRRWAHMLVIAPLSANTMAKIAGGMADGLLTNVVRAWDARGELDPDTDSSVGNAVYGNKVQHLRSGGFLKRILVAPAMNTAMWRHPVTAKQIRVLEEEWGASCDVGGKDRGGWFEVLRPQEKTLACGDTGDGAMMEWTNIVALIAAKLGLDG